MESVQTDAWWLGQNGERILLLGGWIAERDDGNVAHLILSPAGDDVPGKMRSLAAALGLVEATAEIENPEVPPDTLLAEIRGSEVWLRYGHSSWLHRPVTPEWIAAAVQRRMVVLSLVYRAIGGSTIRHYDKAVSRPGHVQLGLVRVTQVL